MKKAISLATRAKGRTSPNPSVGAVIVKNGKIISADYHKKAGMPHAEVLALQKAGRLAKDATLYVNLEPCCHTDKRTPPCTDAIINSGVKRVVAAMLDPNPRVAGKGLVKLKKAGIEITTGILEDEAQRLNESFSKFITMNLPFVTLKIAQSLDGKIATASGDSKWITGEISRRHVHRLRDKADAIMVGIGTVLKDDPSLDCRIRGGRNPFRIIVDSNLRIPLNARLLYHDDHKTIIATTRNAPAGKVKKLKGMGINVLIVPAKLKRVSLVQLMKRLAGMDITSIMIEGGSTLAAAALSERIVDKVLFFIAPMIMGGEDARSSIGGRSPRRVNEAIRLRDVRKSNFGQDILIEGYL